MATVGFRLSLGGGIPSVAGGAEAGPERLRVVELPKRMPKDALGRRITLLIALHPELASLFGKLDLSRMDDAAKQQVLSRVESTLGIHEPLTRRLTEIYD